MKDEHERARNGDIGREPDLEGDPGGDLKFDGDLALGDDLEVDGDLELDGDLGDDLDIDEQPARDDEVRWTPDHPEAVRWAPDGSGIDVLDQTRLPEISVWVRLRTAGEVVEAIRRLQVRGAPAIGITGAMGLALELAQATSLTPAAFRRKLRDTAGLIRAARPTAVNLAWAVDRVAGAAEEELGRGTSASGRSSSRAGASAESADPAARAAGITSAAGASGGASSSDSGSDSDSADPATRGMLEAAAWRAWEEADRIHEEDRAMCRAIGENALALFPEPEDRPLRVMTVCNAGALATGGMGTALAAIYLAHYQGRAVQVWAPETRPLLQGSRITAWELARSGVPVTVIVDSVAADVMARGEVDLVITGADRIAANGDTANKVGTYALAVLARHHGIPFYVAAPTSTIDPATPTGAEIVIEERDPDEVRRGFGRLTAPEEVAVWAPAFDVTPAALITAIITDRGVFRPGELSAGGSGKADGRTAEAEHRPADAEHRGRGDTG